MTSKDMLISQINDIENIELIESISNMLTSVNDEGLFSLNRGLLEELENRSAHITNGEYMTHEEVSKKFK